MAQKSNDAFLSAIEDVKKYLDDYFDREIETRSVLNSVRLKAFGTRLNKIITGHWRKNFERLTADMEK